MIVELVGCTGAGKSTLARLLCAHKLMERGRPATMPELVLGRWAGRDRLHPTIANLVQEVGSLPFLAAAARRRRAFMGFAATTLVRTAPTPLHKANRLRGVARRVGMFELAERTKQSRIVLSDEGTVLLAYMLVLDGRPASAQDVDRFAAVVPVPDLVIHVTAPVDVLVERARARTDRDRQLGGLSAAELGRLLERTVDVFDRTLDAAPMRGRVMTVDGSRAFDAAQVGEIAGSVVQTLTGLGEPRLMPAGERSV